MLAPVDGHLEMVFCDAAAPKPVHHPAMVHVHDMSGMEQGASEQAGSEHGVTGHAHADPTCPYAQSAGPAPLPAVAVLASAGIAHTLAVGETGTQIQSAFGPRRTQTPRAPPLIA